MEEYRQYVGKIAGAPGPSETIMNRSSEHAAVVLEFLFRKANSEIDILTDELAEDVYGTPALIAAAQAFLTNNPAAKISILAESKVDRLAHQFFRAIDGAGLGDRVTIAFVPDNVKKGYTFNFAVTDTDSYRFEEARHSREALVRFSDKGFAQTLRSIFHKLSSSAVKEKLPA